MVGSATEMARNDLRGAGRLALKYPLISEQPERHDGDLVRVVGRVHTCPKRYECKRERDQRRMQSTEPVLQHDNLLKAAPVKKGSRENVGSKIDHLQSVIPLCQERDDECGCEAPQVRLITAEGELTKSVLVRSALARFSAAIAADLKRLTPFYCSLVALAKQL